MSRVVVPRGSEPVITCKAFDVCTSVVSEVEDILVKSFALIRFCNGVRITIIKEYSGCKCV